MLKSNDQRTQAEGEGEEAIQTLTVEARVIDVPLPFPHLISQTVNVQVIASRLLPPPPTGYHCRPAKLKTPHTHQMYSVSTNINCLVFIQCGRDERYEGEIMTWCNAAVMIADSCCLV